jgi:hypothetical protein
MSDLESLEAVAGFSFTANDIKNLVNKFSALGVVAFSPVISFIVSLNGL